MKLSNVKKYGRESLVYMLMHIEEKDFDNDTEIFQNMTISKAYDYQLTPVDFALEYYLMKRNSPSEYKEKIIMLTQLQNEI